MHSIRSPRTTTTESPHIHGNDNNSLLNDNLVREEIKDLLEFNENEGTTYPTLCDTMKAVLKRKTHSPECLHKEIGEITH